VSATPSALRSAVTVSLTRGVAAVLTLAQGILSAQYFGTSLQKDCFLVAQTIPTMVSTFLIGGIYSTLLVNLAEIGRTEGARGQRAFAGRILSRLALCLLAPILFVLARPLWLVHLVAPGFSDEKSVLTASLLRLTLFVAAGFLFLAAVRCLFETRGQFVVPAFISLANPLLSLIVLVTLVGSLGIYTLAIGPMVGLALSLTLLTLAIPRHVTDPAGFTPAPSDLKETARRVRGFWLAFLPMSIGANFGQINVAVDNAFASYLPTGSITMLGFAFVIVSNAQLLTTSTFAEVAFSRLTRAAVSGQAELLALFRSQMRHMLLLTAPLSIGAFAMATPLVRLLFERGAFNPEATAGVAQALRAYAPGIFFLGYLTLFSILLTSKRRFTRIAITAASIIVVNALLDFVFIRAFGLTGIALGTSLTILIHALILSAPARAILGEVRGILDFGYLSKVMTSGAVMGGIVALFLAGFERAFDTHLQYVRLLEVGVGLGLGAGTYAGLLMLLKVREAGTLIRRFLAGVGLPAKAAVKHE
jgi:putative peptidoglycan lipid II flippase